MIFWIYLIFWILSNICFKNILSHFAQCLFILLTFLLWRLFCFYFYVIPTFHYLLSLFALLIFTIIYSSIHLLICILIDLLTYLCFSVAVRLHAVNILKVIRGCHVSNLPFSVHFFWGQDLSLNLVLSSSWVGWKPARHSCFPVSALLTLILIYGLLEFEFLLFQ